MPEVQPQPQQQQQTVEDLGKLVKAKYPDAYGKLPDIEVGQKVKAKYPQYSQFADITKTKPSLSLRGVGSAFLKQGIGGAKQLAQDAYGGLQTVEKLTSGGAVSLPDLPEAMSPHGQEETTGAALMRGGEAASSLVGLGEGIAALRSKALIDLSRKTVWNVASKIPEMKLHPAMDMAVENTPGVGPIYKLAKVLKGKLGRLPTEDELAAEAYIKKYGTKPVGDEVTRARIEYDQFKRGLREAIKPPKIPGAEKAAKEKPVKLKDAPFHGPHEPVKPTAANPVKITPSPSVASSQSDTTPTPSGIAPMGKLKIRADIFANLDQLAAKAGANKTNFKAQFRTLVEKKYGKGLSSMDEKELMEVANGVQELLAQP